MGGGGEERWKRKRQDWPQTSQEGASLPHSDSVWGFSGASSPLSANWLDLLHLISSREAGFQDWKAAGWLLVILVMCSGKISLVLIFKGAISQEKGIKRGDVLQRTAHSVLGWSAGRRETNIWSLTDSLTLARSEEERLTGAHLLVVTSREVPKSEKKS